jgi:hypothetical protein
VYLKVSPMKGVKMFGVKGKLSPRYICKIMLITCLRDPKISMDFKIRF